MNSLDLDNIINSIKEAKEVANQLIKDIVRESLERF